MAAIVFDTLKAARRMIAAGMPAEQAEAQAEIMAEAFVFNVDNLVTKDYLEACLDARFSDQEIRFARIDARFDLLEQRFEAKFRLIYWMLAVVIASTTVPAVGGFILGF